MEHRSRAVSLITAVLLITAVIGLIPLLAPSLMLGARAIPTLMLMTVIALIVVLSILKATRETGGHEKRKRSAEEMDRYAMMEQVVDDLNTDERDYLRQLLDEEEAKQTYPLNKLLEAEADELHHDTIKRR